VLCDTSKDIVVEFEAYATTELSVVKIAPAISK
jgi:hypothetical protein